MEISQLYKWVDGDYNTAIQVMNKEERIEKVILLLPKDGNMQKLMTSLKEDNMKEAFSAAHTLKGIFMNLCLEKHARLAIELTELLREPKDEREIWKMASELEKSYDELIHWIYVYKDTKENRGGLN